jgi:hypothetical protein
MRTGSSAKSPFRCEIELKLHLGSNLTPGFFVIATPSDFSNTEPQNSPIGPFIADMPGFVACLVSVENDPSSTRTVRLSCDRPVAPIFDLADLSS